MTRTPEERLAIVETKIKTLEADIAEMKADVKAILRQLGEARGGWKVLLAIAAIAGAAGAILAKLAPFFR